MHKKEKLSFIPHLPDPNEILKNFGREFKLDFESLAYDKKIRIGKNCVIHPSVVLGEAGFGFERTDEGYVKPLKRRPHNFGIVIGYGVEIGSHSVVHRGRWRDTVIGSYTKIDSGVHVAHNVHIGRNCLVVAGTVIGGSVSIGDDCFIGENVSIKQGLKIAAKTTIGMGSVVLKDITKPNSTWVGNPARKLYNKQKF
jgi:UDP-3-O-[3-hydroxymyristoyl] glucosamine N-acyltransferase